ncbi:MAG: hypothetical protein NXI04_05730 [Planctomycetaceae bacterium]|nr:hypothetical protein [Planctomycetaceae bacterium]
MTDHDPLFTENIKEPINFGRWLGLLITWDGLFPVALIFAPEFLRWMWPGNLPARDMTVVLLVIAALFIRLGVGLKHISSNFCGPWMRTVQKSLLILMVLFLVMMDSLLMIIPFRRGMTAGDVIFLSVVASIYLGGMAVVLYPGRRSRDLDALDSP